MIMSRPLEVIPENPVDSTQIDSISFEDIKFRYHTIKRYAVNGISFHANKGETVAFVGPSGSGKSTLIKLMIGLYQPASGRILYNGIESDKYHLDMIRRRIGFVTQDTQLFSGTIKDNLTFVKPDATDEDCLSALNKAACQGMLSRAENGIHTLIGESGVKISGGEKQRLSIARALLRHPDILLFDEATSALDSITEEEISKTVQHISNLKNRITLIIAHRLSTIMHADRIYVLENGQVVEVGNHDALVDQKGLYYAMWRQQSGERRLQEELDAYTENEV
jgi:ATP-binding cassette subfamily B protein